jgi:RNA polymerase sigma factor (sigma-70 family)
VYTPAPSYNEQRYNEDLALWQAFRAGQQQALATLFDRYAQQLYAYGHQLIGDEEGVKDGIQTVFVNLWARREHLALEVSVKFYLYGILRRELLKSRKETRMWAQRPAGPDNEPSVEQLLVASEDEHQRTLKLSASLGLLSGREKEIINLKYFNNFKIREIADLLQLNEQTVSNLLYRALQKLRRSFMIGVLLLMSGI